MIKIGSLWHHTDKKGRPYYSGNFGDGSIMIFENSFKEKDNQPDLIMYIADKKKKGETDGDHKKPNNHPFG